MEKTIRPVKQIIDPQHVIEGAGVLAAPLFRPQPHQPVRSVPALRPFRLQRSPRRARFAGFPTHPHRGIETVTYMLEGNVRHRDSIGNAGVIGPGDVQWMTSGRGILHEEMPTRGPDGRHLRLPVVGQPARGAKDEPAALPGS